jgi:NO-binding membrane sensor protein with MHYT domain
MPVSGIAHIRSYDLRVVGLSVAIAVLGAYAGLDLAERVTAARGGARVAWLIGGSRPLDSSGIYLPRGASRPRGSCIASP